MKAVVGRPLEDITYAVFTEFLSLDGATKIRVIAS